MSKEGCRQSPLLDWTNPRNHSLFESLLQIHLLNLVLQHLTGSGSRKLTPNLDQNGTKLLNLTVLQRIDPSIEVVLITATHVTFYEFDIGASEWSRKDVEGSLFVVKRNTQPRFQFVVMNRRNTDNFVENLLGDFEFEVQIPYLLYRNAAQEVNGIWFYEPHECVEVANLFTRIISAYSKVNPKPQIPSKESEFGELEKDPTLATLEGPLEHLPETTSTVREVPEDSSFMRFFRGGMVRGKHTETVNPGKNCHVSLNAAMCASSAAPGPATAVPDLVSSNNRVPNLLKPSSFFHQSASSGLMMPPISSPIPIPARNSPSIIQLAKGKPVFQPFLPPTAPPAFSPSPPRIYGAGINRDKDNQFVDKFYEALIRSHNS